MELSFVVRGRPAPQGSHDVTARGVLVQASRHLIPWRQRIVQAAVKARMAWSPDDPEWLDASWPTLQGPAWALIVFVVRGSVTAPPDLDKLVRGTLDALTFAQVWADDSLVTRMSAMKVNQGDRVLPECARGLTEGAYICVGDEE